MSELLKRRWLALWPDHAQPDLVNDVWEGLLAHYSGNGRFYHNLTHIQRMLDMAAELSALTQDYRAVVLAVWFHDVIYDPQAKDNEAQSAVYAREVLSALGETPRRIDHVAALIEATVHQATTVTDPDMRVVLDADLATMASPLAEYASYSRAIRQEYGYVDDAAYVDGRIRVLQHFLNRDPLYFTDVMKLKTAAAHRNMALELAALSQSPPATGLYM